MTDLFNQLMVIFGESVGTITLTLLILGLALIILEFFIPGFAFSGVMGIVISLTGIVYRISMGLNFVQSLILISICGLTMLVCYLIFIISIKSGLLSRSQLFCHELSIPQEFDNMEKKSLLGKCGVTTTICKPVGKAIIDENEYEVLAEDSYLDKNMNIKVIRVTNDSVVVIKI